ncbi:hypothetical protein CS0771_26090 [Catellatospora sp. IY07-71]|uniref:hypothetical protein n=1 Tax=Catellatospora sp. IY07-71 TaxID=2728827 RepID=UPI001BB32D55|nr:hypothetical protein [Catellatospora sp. IY07-71]BCJ73065.1 hypothetical protein CS0771_26090 [Catellatospora sp. IY07-71]
MDDAAMRREFEAILAASGLAVPATHSLLSFRIRYWARLVRAGRMTRAEFDQRVAAARRELRAAGD